MLTSNGYTDIVWANKRYTLFTKSLPH